MLWVQLGFVAIGVCIIFFAALSKQTAAVPVEHQAPLADGTLRAIEYYWRPG